MFFILLYDMLFTNATFRIKVFFQCIGELNGEQNFSVYDTDNGVIIECIKWN